MSRQPTPIEREHYRKLVGRTITGILWDELEDESVLTLTDWDRDGNVATGAVFRDPEGNGPGHLDHQL